MELVDFSKWKIWERREELDGLDYPGVYALAVSIKNITDRPFSLIKEIKYFGMTNQNKDGLRGRLNQFQNTIIGKIGHGGAERFLFKYKNYNALKKRLFVSVNFTECDVNSYKPEDLCRMGGVANFEYICFAEYAKKFGRLPEFNDKKLSSKAKKEIKRN
ncbi:MAG TPA: hypothetical protein ACFYEK_12580 [Candidatus Wunengus sp. YC60]|uniref:hypothetical protein n=1 Tax=Candidatus Wunengus sp. YC60 TaxID=3367697 RepID=UPI00402917B0